MRNVLTCPRLVGGRASLRRAAFSGHSATGIFGLWAAAQRSFALPYDRRSLSLRRRRSGWQGIRRGRRVWFSENLVPPLQQLVQVPVGDEKHPLFEFFLALEALPELRNFLVEFLIPFLFVFGTFVGIRRARRIELSTNLKFYITRVIGAGFANCKIVFKAIECCQLNPEWLVQPGLIC